MVTLVAAAGAVVHFFPTGQGNVIGNPILPVIKISGNPRTVRTMSEHIDVDVTAILRREMNMDQAGDVLLDMMVQTANGRNTSAEVLGHREIVMTKLYRSAYPPGVRGIRSRTREPGGLSRREPSGGGFPVKADAPGFRLFLPSRPETAASGLFALIPSCSGSVRFRKAPDSRARDALEAEATRDEDGRWSRFSAVRPCTCAGRC